MTGQEDTPARPSRVSALNQERIDSTSTAARPHVRAIAQAVEQWDVDAARKAASVVPDHLRDEVATQARALHWTTIDLRLQPEASVGYESASPGALAYWVALAMLLDSPQALAGTVHDYNGDPIVHPEDIERELADRPEAWRKAFHADVKARRHHTVTWRRRNSAGARRSTRSQPTGPVDVLRGDWCQLPKARAVEDAIARQLDALWTTPDAGRTVGRRSPSDGPYRDRDAPPDRSVRSDEQWAGLLEAWGAKDEKTRPRVLDACLGALAGAAGDQQGDLRGWIVVHGRLGLTDLELEERQERYLALSASGATDPARLARSIITRLLTLGALDPDALLDVTGDCLARPEKSAVQQWLTLLSSAVDAGLIVADTAAEVVQESIDLLPRGADADASRLLARWGADASPAAPAVETWIPPLPADLPSAGAVEPVKDVDELVDLLLAIENDASDAIAIERAVDGLLRLRDPDRAVEPHLRHRLRDASGLRDLVQRWFGYRAATPPFDSRARYGVNEVRRESRYLRDVPGGQIPDHTIHPDRPPGFQDTWTWGWDEVLWTPHGLTGARLRAMGDLVRGTPTTSLALPTGAHGGIDGATLVTRIRERRSAEKQISLRELVAALLRLDPADREEFFAVATKGPQAATLRFLLEAPRPFAWGQVAPRTRNYERAEWPSIAVWSAAPSFPERDDDEPMRLWLDTRESVDNWWSYLDPYGSWTAKFARPSGWLLQLPWHVDVACVHLQPLLMSYNENAGIDLSPILAQLARTRAPLAAQAADVLIWTSSYQNARTRASAGETIAALAKTGLLEGSTLAESVLRLAGPDAGPFFGPEQSDAGPPKLSRIASTLKDSSRIDEYGERVVLDTVIGCLASLKEMRGGVALLEIAAEIAERRGFRAELPEPLRSLAEGKARTRLAQEARRLAGDGRPGAALYRPDFA